MNNGASDFSVILEIGSEFAPDSPRGREVIRLDGSGALTYESFRGPVRKESSSGIEPQDIARIREYLALARFPEVPEHSIPPGGGLVAITVREGPSENKVYLHYHRAGDFEGYRELIAMADTWMASFRETVNE